MRSLLFLTICLAILALTLALPRESAPLLRAGKSRAVEDAVRRLESDLHEERRRAENLLVSLGDDSMAALRLAQASPDAEVRKRAGSAMRAIEGAHVDPRDRLQREYMAIISVALDSPWELLPGANRFEALLLDLERASLAASHIARKVERWPLRHDRCVALLRDLGHPAGADYLADLIARGTFLPSVLHRAAEGLIAFGGPEALAGVREALSGHEAVARKFALRVLGRRGDASDVDRIRALASDSSDVVRREAAVAIAALAGRHAVDDLILLTGDTSPVVRAAAFEELSWLSQPRAADRALAALSDPSPEVRAAALRTMAACGSSEYAAAVVTLRRDPSARVRAAVVHALAELGSAESAVRTGSRDRSPAVRRQALLASRRLPLSRRRAILEPAPEEPDLYLLSLRKSLLSLAEAN